MEQHNLFRKQVPHLWSWEDQSRPASRLTSPEGRVARQYGRWRKWQSDTKGEARPSIAYGDEGRTASLTNTVRSWSGMSSRNEQREGRDQEVGEVHRCGLRLLCWCGRNLRVSLL